MHLSIICLSFPQSYFIFMKYYILINVKILNRWIHDLVSFITLKKIIRYSIFKFHCVVNFTPRTQDKFCCWHTLIRFLVSWKPTRCHYKPCIVTAWQVALWTTWSSGRNDCRPLRLCWEHGWMFKNSGLS